jgi:hypothetical protein
MKSLSLFLIAVVLLPFLAHPQALPDAPTPAPDPAWDRLKNLTNGEPIIVRNDNGPPVHCLFAGATEAYLFCNPPRNPPGVGFRFDRSSVVSVDRDLPAQYTARFDRPQRDYHPAWIASILGGGLIVGLCATRTMNDGDSARVGAIGALVVAVIGAPLAFLPRPEDAGFAYRPRNIVSVPVGRVAPRPHLHLRPIRTR